MASANTSRSLAARSLIVRQLPGFGLGVVATTFVALGLIVLGTGHQEWWLAPVPTWLEGVGTAVACMLAWAGYRGWRKQEGAKRKAEVAEKVLRAAFVLTTLMRDSRFTMIMQKETAKGDVLKSSAEMFASLRSGKLEACAEPAAELQSWQSLARIYFHAKAGEAIEQLLDFREDLKVAADYLSQFKSKWVEGEAELEVPVQYDEPIEFFMFGDEWLLELLRTVGMHTDPTAVDEKRQDETDRRIVSTMKNLEAILEPYLTLGEVAVDSE